MNTSVKNTAHILPESSAGMSLLRLPPVSTTWFSHDKGDKLPTFGAATKQLLSLHVLVLLHIYLDNHHQRIWFGITPYFFVDIVLCTSAIDHFIWVIISSTCKGVLWHSKLIAIMNRSLSLKTDSNSKQAPNKIAWCTYSQAHKTIANEITRVAR